jgi:hypothetical protein
MSKRPMIPTQRLATATLGVGAVGRDPGALRRGP